MFNQGVSDKKLNFISELVEIQKSEISCKHLQSFIADVLKLHTFELTHC